VIKKMDIPVKILGNGELNKPIEITADMFSKSAIEKLEKAGGKAIYK
jgi:large subunit ribosomal protein L15